MLAGHTEASPMDPEGMRTGLAMSGRERAEKQVADTYLQAPITIHNAKYPYMRCPAMQNTYMHKTCAEQCIGHNN